MPHFSLSAQMLDSYFSTQINSSPWYLKGQFREKTGLKPFCLGSLTQNKAYNELT